jgi:hypothetical protein
MALICRDTDLKPYKVALHISKVETAVENTLYWGMTFGYEGLD